LQLKSRIVVLAAQNIDMTRQDTGERITGVNVFYVDSEPSESPNQIGALPARSWMPSEFWPVLLKAGPGQYDGEFRAVKKDGSSSLRLVGLQPAGVKSGG